MNRFIDDVSVLAIEDCLIGGVSDLFRPRKVLKMSPEDISRLAGETTESSVERKHLEEKRDILDAGLRGLKGLQKQRRFAHRGEWKPVSSEDVKSKAGKTTPSPENASTASSVKGAFPVMNSRDQADLPPDEGFQLPAAPPTDEWRVQELQMTRDEEWDFAVPSIRVAKKWRNLPYLTSVHGNLK